MTELTTYNDPTPDVTAEERSILRKAGASEELLQVCQVQLKEIERRDGKKPTRHSVLEETKKYLRGTQAIDAQLTEENAEDFSPYGGHFYMAVWEGDLFRAYSRADHNNKPILLKKFGVRRINDDRPARATSITV